MPRNSGCVPSVGSCAAAAVSFAISEDLQGLDAIAEVETHRTDRRIVSRAGRRTRGAGESSRRSTCCAETSPASQNSAAPKGPETSNRSLHRGLPLGEAADGNGALGHVVPGLPRDAAERDLRRRRRGVQEGNDAVRGDAAQGKAAVRARTAREEAAEVDDLDVAVDGAEDGVRRTRQRARRRGCDRWFCT